MKEIQAKLRYVSISAQKIRLLADQIRSLNVGKALSVLSFSKSGSSIMLKNVLNSAVANAEHNNGMDMDKLYVSTIFIDKGPTIKRFEARAKGRGNRILKRTSHVTLRVAMKS